MTSRLKLPLPVPGTNEFPQMRSTMTHDAASQGKLRESPSRACKVRFAMNGYASARRRGIEAVPPWMTRRNSRFVRRRLCEEECESSSPTISFTRPCISVSRSPSATALARSAVSGTVS